VLPANLRPNINNLRTKKKIFRPNKYSFRENPRKKSWWWCYPTPSERCCAEELHGDPTVEPRPKVWTKGQKWKKLCQRWHAGEARMHNNPGRGESSPTEGVRRRCMKNSPSVLSCKRTREGCDRCSKVGTVHSG